MGFLGWLARRALAAWIWAPLVALWYGVFVLVFKVTPGAMGAPGGPEQRAVILAIVFGSITDWLIVRRVKKAMKAREARAHAQNPPR